MQDKLLRSMYYRLWKTRTQRRLHQQQIQKIRCRGQARVVFLAANLPMWRYDGILKLMMKDSRFLCSIIVHPMKNYSLEETQNNERIFCDYCRSLGVDFHLSTTKDDKKSSLRIMQEADIIFYPQPYGDLFGDEFDNIYYREKLLCYIPYGVTTFSSEWAFNTALHNQAWRIYSESEFHRKEAQRIATNKGVNVVVVGNPLADQFLFPNKIDVWKQQPVQKKRIIWAPHFSIMGGLERNAFLWMAEPMLDVARKYANQVQFAFKPHPRLLSTLYSQSDWGKQRADDYYHKWEELPNGQYESRDYVDLFAKSDAMIHDCGSFAVEYLYTRHPVMFVSDKIEAALNAVNDFGRQALLQHYVGSSMADVCLFIEQTVLQGVDPKQEDREQYFQQYLLPPHKSNVAENVYNDIVKSIFSDYEDTAH